MLKPILTEKSLRDAKEGAYSFWVDMNLTKYEVKKLVEEVFKVHVKRIRIAKKGGSVSKKMRKIRVILPQKKAIVRLKEKEKIELFEELSKK